MTAAPQPQTVNMLHAALAYAQRLGWPVFPVHGIKDMHCTCNRAQCKRPGKHPVGHLVPQGLKNASTDIDVIKHWWREAPWANIGVVTGAESSLVVLDVDVIKGGDDALFEIQQKHGPLPETVQALTGSGGYHYLFAHPGSGVRIKNSVSSLGTGLDIRGDGGYIVVAPSLHLYGRRYEWEASCRPLEVEIAPLPEWLLAHIQDDRVTPVSPTAGSLVLTPDEMARIRSALVYIDCEERDPWLEVGMALHSTGAGKQAYALWCEWAQQSDKFDLKDSARVWRSFKPKADGITLDTLFARSRAVGWADPDQVRGAELAARLMSGPAVTDRFEAELQRANGQGVQYAAVDTPKWTPTPLPVPLLAVLEREILRRVPVQHPIAAQQTALAIAARIAGRHTVTTSGDPTNLYLALAAPSVGDVRPYLHQAELIMEQAGLQQSVRKSRLSVIGQIQKTLWRQPATLYLCSEWGILLQFAKRQPAGSLEMALGLLAELWDGTTLSIDADDIKLPDAEGGQQVVRAPRLSMLALLSHDQLATAVKMSEMGRGALEQIQYWVLDDEDFAVVDPDEITTAPYPDDLIAELKRLSESPFPATGNLSGVMPWVMPQQVQARFAVAIQPFYARLDALQPHRSARSLLATSRLIIRRIVNDLAYFNAPESPIITEQLIEWCMDGELARLKTLFERFPSLSGEDGKTSVYDKVLEFITSEKARGCGTRALQQYCRPYRNLPDDKREALIKQMLADESIVELQPESKPGSRRKALIYVAKQFVREVAP